MAQTSETTPFHLGFLTVLRDTNGFLGGYLVTNRWGRPLEFRLTTAVQPNRVQQILYGETLDRYLCADLIGKSLIEKTATPVRLVLTDTEAALDLRHHLAVPVGCICLSAEKKASLREPSYHPAYPADVAAASELLALLDACFDLAEPFQRIRDAVAEARKMGVTSRAA